MQSPKPDVSLQELLHSNRLKVEIKCTAALFILPSSECPWGNKAGAAAAPQGPA